MKKSILLLAVLVLAGCSSPLIAGRSQTATAQNAPATRYEHQLAAEYGEGTTQFLHLVDVNDP